MFVLHLRVVLLTHGLHHQLVDSFEHLLPELLAIYDYLLFLYGMALFL